MMLFVGLNLVAIAAQDSNVCPQQTFDFSMNIDNLDDFDLWDSQNESENALEGCKVRCHERYKKSARQTPYIIHGDASHKTNAAYESCRFFYVNGTKCYYPNTVSSNELTRDEKNNPHTVCLFSNTQTPGDGDGFRTCVAEEDQRIQPSEKENEDAKAGWEPSVCPCEQSAIDDRNKYKEFINESLSETRAMCKKLKNMKNPYITVQDAKYVLEEANKTRHNAELKLREAEDDVKRAFTLAFLTSRKLFAACQVGAGGIDTTTECESALHDTIHKFAEHHFVCEKANPDKHPNSVVPYISFEKDAVCGVKEINEFEHNCLNRLAQAKEDDKYFEAEWLDAQSNKQTAAGFFNGLYSELKKVLEDKKPSWMDQSSSTEANLQISKIHKELKVIEIEFTGKPRQLKNRMFKNWDLTQKHLHDIPHQTLSTNSKSSYPNFSFYVHNSFKRFEPEVFEDQDGAAVSSLGDFYCKLLNADLHDSARCKDTTPDQIWKEVVCSQLENEMNRVKLVVDERAEEILQPTTISISSKSKVYCNKSKTLAELFNSNSSINVYTNPTNYTYNISRIKEPCPYGLGASEDNISIEELGEFYADLQNNFKPVDNYNNNYCRSVTEIQNEIDALEFKCADSLQNEMCCKQQRNNVHFHVRWDAYQSYRAYRRSQTNFLAKLFEFNEAHFNMKDAGRCLAEAEIYKVNETQKERANKCDKKVETLEGIKDEYKAVEAIKQDATKKVETILQEDAKDVVYPFPKHTIMESNQIILENVFAEVHEILDISTSLKTNIRKIVREVIESEIKTIQQDILKQVQSLTEIKVTQQDILKQVQSLTEIKVTQQDIIKQVQSLKEKLG